MATHYFGSMAIMEVCEPVWVYKKTFLFFGWTTPVSSGENVSGADKTVLTDVVYFKQKSSSASG